MRGGKEKKRTKEKENKGKGGRHTILIVVTHLGRLGEAARLDGFFAAVSSVGVPVDAARLARLYSVLLNVGSGRVLNRAVVGSLDGERAGGLNTGAVLAFSNINRAGGVVVVMVYLDTSLGEVRSRRSSKNELMSEKGCVGVRMEEIVVVGG